MKKYRLGKKHFMQFDGYTRTDKYTVRCIHPGFGGFSHLALLLNGAPPFPCYYYTWHHIFGNIACTFVSAAIPKPDTMWYYRDIFGEE